MKLVLVSGHANFYGLGTYENEIRDKQTRKKKRFQKNRILLFRVLELLTDLQFGLRQFHWFQLMQKTGGWVYAQAVGHRFKKNGT